MRHIHTSIVSRHLSTRGNKILRTPPPHIISSIFPRLTRRTLAQLKTINHPSSKYAYTKLTPKHIHHHYAPSVTLTHTTSLQLHPHPHHIVTPIFVDIPCRSECTAGQMDGEAGCWTTRGKFGLTPLARVMGVGRQQ